MNLALPARGAAGWDFWEEIGADRVPNTLDFMMKAYGQNLNRTLKSKHQDGNYDL